MSDKNYSIVVSNIQAFSSHHEEIRRFKCSYLSNMESFANADNQFPILYMSPINIQNSNSLNSYSFKIYCLDRLNSDASNEISIHNTTQLILQDLCVWLRQSDNGFFLDNDPVIEPLETYLMDGLAGWSVTISVSSSTYMYDCSSPISEGLDGYVTTNYGTSGSSGTSGTNHGRKGYSYVQNPPAPTNAVEGDIWFDLSTGIEFIYVGTTTGNYVWVGIQ